MKFHRIKKEENFRHLLYVNFRQKLLFRQPVSSLHYNFKEAFIWEWRTLTTVTGYNYTIAKRDQIITVQCE